MAFNDLKDRPQTPNQAPDQKPQQQPMQNPTDKMSSDKSKSSGSCGC